MEQGETSWAWSEDKYRAAYLLAEGRLYDEQIAERLGMSRTQLWRWKKNPEFAAKVEEHAKEIEDDVIQKGIACRRNRIRRQNDAWERMQRVIEERAADPSMQDVPGGKTGLMVRTMKGIGGGDNLKVVEEYEFDAALVKELRDHEKQAAQELGQWTEKHQHDMNSKIVVVEDDNWYNNRAHEREREAAKTAASLVSPNPGTAPPSPQ